MPVVIQHTDRGILETREIGVYQQPGRKKELALPVCTDADPEKMAIRVEMFLDGEMNVLPLVRDRNRIRDHISKCDFCRLKAKGLSPRASPVLPGFETRM